MENFLTIVLSLIFIIQIFLCLFFVFYIFWGLNLSEKKIKNISRFFHLILISLLGLIIGKFLNSPFDQIINFGEWIHVKEVSFHFVLRLDLISLVYLSLNIIISFIIFQFSYNYLHKDRNFLRFFFLIQTLSLAVTIIALAGNFSILFIGWEFAGLASVLLISFFNQNIRSSQNALRGIIYYRICDVMMLLALIILHHDVKLEHSMLIGILFILSTCAKSGQLPFANFLPRAMEGPTSSSAIFYGALSIHLGPFLLLRSWDYWHPFIGSKILVFIIGFLTAIYATFVGRTRSDAKTQLANSAVAQVGLIYIELSLGYKNFALYHIISHACLRIIQFLYSSSLIDSFSNNIFYNNQISKIKKFSFVNLIPSVYFKKLYIHAVQGFYLDAIQFDLIVLPTIEFFKKIKESILIFPLRNKHYFYAIIFSFFLYHLLISINWLDMDLKNKFLSLLIFIYTFYGIINMTQALILTSIKGIIQALISSYLGLVLVGMVLNEIGSVGSILLLINIVLCYISLRIMTKDFHQKYQIDTINRYLGLAVYERKSEFLFLFTGIFLIGMPGGLTFLAEDLLFFSLHDYSLSLTFIWVLIMGLNGIAFFRLYQYIFNGTPFFDRSNNLSSNLIIIPQLILLLIFILSVFPKIYLEYGTASNLVP